MAQAGFTPIRLYYSTTALTAPAAGNLAAGELAINITDEKLYFKNNSGVVKILADSGTATGNLPGGSTGSVVYQASTGVTTYLTLGSPGSLLFAGASAPQYVALGAQGSLLYANASSSTPAYAPIGTPGSILYAGASAPTSVALGSQGSLLFAGASAPQYLPLGTSSWILTAGATTPAYVNPSSISVGFATNAGKATDISGGATNQILYQTATGFTGFVTAPTVPGFVLGWNGTTFNWVAAPAATTAINLAGGTAGEVVFQTAPGTTGYTTGGVNGYLLTSSGTSAPTWSNPASLTVGNATTAGSSSLATNIAGGTAGEIPYQTAPNGTAFTTGGVAGYLLSSNGASAPSWLNPTTITVGTATSANTATNVSGGTAGEVLYQSAPGSSSFTTGGVAGYFLGSNGTSAPTWLNPASVTVGNATNAVNATNATNAANATNAVNATTSNNLAGGIASQIPYQTGSGVTAFIPNGNAGQILTSNGTSAPSWQDQVPAVSKGFVYFCAQF